MNKSVNKALRVVMALVILCVTFFSAKVSSFATDIVSAPYIIVDSYGVEGDAIVSGKQFTLKMTIKNVDATKTAQNTIVSIAASAGISPAYKEVPQIFVGNLGPGETKDIEFKCKAQEALTISTALFNVTIATDLRTNTVVISVPVEDKKEAISVISTNIPKEATVSEAFSSEIRFRASKEDSFSDVNMNVEVDGQLVDSYRIGNMSAGATKTQNSTIYFYEEGFHELSYLISFMDSKGDVREVVVYNDKVNVGPKEEVQSNEPAVSSSPMDRFSDRDIGIMTGCILGSLIFAVAIVLVLRKNR